MVWTDLGESDWSAPSEFELGLLEAGDWSAQWIEPVEARPGPPGARAAMLVRGEFELEPSSATGAPCAAVRRPLTGSTSCLSTASGSATAS